MRIYQYYLPVYFWCLQQLELHRRENGAGQPLILGMQAPQVLNPQPLARWAYCTQIHLRSGSKKQAVLAAASRCLYPMQFK